MVFEQFQECHHGGHLGYWNGTILAILNLHVNPKLTTKFGLHPTACGSRCGLKSFKMAAVTAILDIGTKILAILNLHVAPMPPTKFQLNPTFDSGDVKKCEKLKTYGLTTDNRPRHK